MLLPDELWIEIMLFLESNQIYALMRTCRSLWYLGCSLHSHWHRVCLREKLILEKESLPDSFNGWFHYWTFRRALKRAWIQKKDWYTIDIQQWMTEYMAQIKNKNESHSSMLDALKSPNRRRPSTVDQYEIVPTSTRQPNHDHSLMKCATNAAVCVRHVQSGQIIGLLRIDLSQCTLQTMNIAFTPFDDALIQYLNKNRHAQCRFINFSITPSRTVYLFAHDFPASSPRSDKSKSVQEFLENFSTSIHCLWVEHESGQKKYWTLSFEHFAKQVNGPIRYAEFSESTVTIQMAMGGKIYLDWITGKVLEITASNYSGTTFPHFPLVYTKSNGESFTYNTDQVTFSDKERIDFPHLSRSNNLSCQMLHEAYCVLSCFNDKGYHVRLMDLNRKELMATCIQEREQNVALVPVAWTRHYFLVRDNQQQKLTWISWRDLRSDAWAIQMPSFGMDAFTRIVALGDRAVALVSSTHLHIHHV